MSHDDDEVYDDTLDIRALEHLTSFIWQTFDSFQAGGHVDVAQAKLQVQQELQRMAAGDFQLEGRVCAWLRLSWQQLKDESCGDALHLIIALRDVTRELGIEILSARWLGPRCPEDSPVAYVVIASETSSAFIKVVSALDDGGIDVRDANFGGVVI